jgi:hypothetical protein
MLEAVKVANNVKSLGSVLWSATSRTYCLPYPIWMEHYASTVEKPLWLANYKLVHIANQAEHLLTRDPVLKSFAELSEEQHALYRSFLQMKTTGGICF